MNLKDKILLTDSLLKYATAAVRIRQRFQNREIYKEICRGIHCKQIEELEQNVERSGIPLFQKQLLSVCNQLREIGGISTKSVNQRSDRAILLTEQVFHPRSWDQELVNRFLPPLVKGMIEAIQSEVEIAKEKSIEFGLSEKRIKSTKQVSTATEYLEGKQDIQLPEIVFSTPYGDVPIRISTELPDWMKREIETRLKETFAQSYWTAINDSTKGDITRFLEEGLKYGWSTRQIADAIEEQLVDKGDYAKYRARNIARTEAGHALNGARSIAIDELIADFGDELPIKKIWLSVLGNTTRDEHANMDGVPSEKDGTWIMVENGNQYKVRWPSDTNLPPSLRCFCQCTISSAYGLTDSEAQSLREEYYRRVGI